MRQSVRSSTKKECRRDHYNPANGNFGKVEGINVFVNTWYKSDAGMTILKKLRDSKELDGIIAAL